MNIFVLRQDNNSTLDRIVMSLMPSDQQRIQRDDIRIINSSYVTLPGLRAWQQIYYDYANNKSMKALLVLTVNDGEEYQLIFMTQPGEFNKYLDCRKNDKVISDNEINYP